MPDISSDPNPKSTYELLLELSLTLQQASRLAAQIATSIDDNRVPAIESMLQHFSKEKTGDDALRDFAAGFSDSALRQFAADQTLERITSRLEQFAAAPEQIIRSETVYPTEQESLTRVIRNFDIPPHAPICDVCGVVMVVVEVHLKGEDDSDSNHNESEVIWECPNTDREDHLLEMPELDADLLADYDIHPF